MNIVVSGNTKQKRSIPVYKELRLANDLRNRPVRMRLKGGKGKRRSLLLQNGFLLSSLINKRSSLFDSYVHMKN